MTTEPCPGSGRSVDVTYTYRDTQVFWLWEAGDLDDEGSVRWLTVLGFFTALCSLGPLWRWPDPAPKRVVCEVLPCPTRSGCTSVVWPCQGCNRDRTRLVVVGDE